VKYAIVGIVILALSVAGAWWLGARGKPSGDEQRPPRVLVLALYFWLLAFAQLIIAAVVYAMVMR
jgi:hypothetical protein